jgi:N-acetylmuramic acid 6-phosphate etherase
MKKPSGGRSKRIRRARVRYVGPILSDGPPRSRWQRLSTEAINPRTLGIDKLSLAEIVEVMILDNRQVLQAVRREKSRIAQAAGILTRSLKQRGRLILVGAGTSGRLGVLEAAEMPPTFGTPVETVQAVMAGGPVAVHRAKEGVEDDYDAGARALRRLRPTRKDVVIGISASGITPFVRGAMAYANTARAATIGVTCDPRSELRVLANVTVILVVGPEVIAGSTRLKAGTATKIVLNMLTTAAMIRVGKTYGNLMVDVKSNSDKLRDRARRIIVTVTGLDDDEADALLRRAQWNVKAAIVMAKARLTRGQALARLRAANDSVREAIGEDIEPRLRKLLRSR